MVDLHTRSPPYLVSSFQWQISTLWYCPCSVIAFGSHAFLSAAPSIWNTAPRHTSASETRWSFQVPSPNSLLPVSCPFPDYNLFQHERGYLSVNKYVQLHFCQIFVKKYILRENAIIWRKHVDVDRLLMQNGSIEDEM